MRTRKTHKLSIMLSMVLIITMLFSTAGVYANEPVANDDDFVVTYSAEEITDIDELVTMALEEKNQPEIRSFIENDGNPKSLIATQLIESRVYNDSHDENDYLVSVMALPYPHDHYMPDEYTGGYGVAGVMQMYFTHTMINSVDYVTVKYNRAKVMQKDGNVKINLWWSHVTSWDHNPVYAEKTITTNASLNTWYTWSINSSQRKVLISGGGIGAGADFIVNGSTSMVETNWGPNAWGCNDY